MSKSSRIISDMDEHGSMKVWAALYTTHGDALVGRGWLGLEVAPWEGRGDNPAA